MAHILRLEDDRKLCELEPGQDMLEIGFVKVGTDDDFPCVACSIVIHEANKALDEDHYKRRRNDEGSRRGSHPPGEDM